MQDERWGKTSVDKHGGKAKQETELAGGSWLGKYACELVRRFVNGVESGPGGRADGREMREGCHVPRSSINRIARVQSVAWKPERSWRCFDVGTLPVEGVEALTLEEGVRGEAGEKNSLDGTSSDGFSVCCSILFQKNLSIECFCPVPRIMHVSYRLSRGVTSCKGRGSKQATAIAHPWRWDQENRGFKRILLDLAIYSLIWNHE